MSTSSERDKARSTTLEERLKKDKNVSDVRILSRSSEESSIGSGLVSTCASTTGPISFKKRENKKGGGRKEKRGKK